MDILLREHQPTAARLGKVEQERVAKSVSTEREPRTHQALLILVAEQPITQALAVVILFQHLVPLRRQLRGQGAAIVEWIGTARKAVPGLSQRTHIARDHARAITVARLARRADWASSFKTRHRALELRTLRQCCLSERMPERAGTFPLRRSACLGGRGFGRSRP